MKLIIDITDEEYKDIKDNPSLWSRHFQTIIENGTPVSNDGDLISRSNLKKAFDKWWGCDDIPATVVEDLIDNAPTQVVSSEKINCPQDLNQYLICEPIFENTFSLDDCESRKFYGDCYHCFASAIAKRDRQIKQPVRQQGEWIIHPHSMIMKCPLCGHEENAKDVGTINPDKHFCSNCGADLRGKEE